MSCRYPYAFGHAGYFICVDELATAPRLHAEYPVRLTKRVLWCASLWRIKKTVSLPCVDQILSPAFRTQSPNFAARRYGALLDSTPFVICDLEVFNLSR